MEEIKFNYRFKSEESKRVKAMKSKNKRILENVKSVCDNNNGYALIGETYVIVDTNKFRVIEKC